MGGYVLVDEESREVNRWTDIFKGTFMTAPCLVYATETVFITRYSLFFKKPVGFMRNHEQSTVTDPS